MCFQLKNHLPNTMDVSDGELNLSAHFLLIDLHLHDLERESLVEQS